MSFITLLRFPQLKAVESYLAESFAKTDPAKLDYLAKESSIRAYQEKEIDGAIARAFANSIKALNTIQPDVMRALGEININLGLSDKNIKLLGLNLTQVLVDCARGAPIQYK
jgi:hypothetical protein